MKKWMYLMLALVWGVIAVAVLGSEGMLVHKDISLITSVSDTATDVMSGTVDDGDSGATFIVVDEADFRTFEGGDGAGQAIWFDTAAWTDTAHLSAYADNDSGNTTLRIFVKSWLSGAGHRGFTTGTVTFDSGSHDFTRTLVSTANDSQFVITPALLVSAQGLLATFTFNHDTLEMVIDSVDATLPDTVIMTAKLGHVVAGWNYRIWRGGEITTYVDTGAWFEVPIANQYDIHMRCVKFSQKDSVIAKTKLQAKMVNLDIDNQPIDICSLYNVTDTTLAPANWFKFPFLDPDGGPDTTWANGGQFGLAFRFISTVVDSESRPANYGRGDYVRFLNFIRTKY